MLAILEGFWEPLKNPLMYAVPVFAICIAVEAWFYAWDARNDRREAVGKGYLSVDTRTSISAGLGSVVSMFAFKLLTFGIFTSIYVYLAPWHLPMNTWWSWILIILLVDLAWYCNHRFSHRVRIGWAAHQMHHSSIFFNLGTALRQKWNPWTEFLFWLPLPLLGVPPIMIYGVFGFNLIYQFFVHTERVGKLWGPIELIFNTPSHHRVHHGSDSIYLDRNYAGIFIIWDRLFGTFQKEIFTPKYGLTKDVDSYNLFFLQYHEYGNIWRDVRNARGLRAKLGFIFGPPGWNPDEGAPVLPANDDPARAAS